MDGKTCKTCQHFDAPHFYCEEQIDNRVGTEPACDKYKHWCENSIKIVYKPKNLSRYEWMKTLSLDDMAKVLCDTIVDCQMCKFILECHRGPEGYKHWLKQEVENAR